MSNPHEVKTVKCAHCGKVRQETNHWFVSAVERGRFRCRLLVPQTPAGTNGRPVGTGHNLKKFEEPACGQQCAQKLFERYLASEAIRRQQ
jgi:hypothetical protein